MMTEGSRPGQDRLEREALSWFVRNQQQAEPDSGFDAWRTADPRHDNAYARIERLWNSAAFGAAAARLPRRRPRKAMSAALSIVIALGGTAMTMRLTGTPFAWPSDHATRTGSVTETRLADGSLVTLDTASAIDMTYTVDARRIDLKHGRVFVTVAADHRPFSIVADGAVIRDIGTRFSVEKRDGAVLVAVRDGIVDMAGEGGAHLRLVAGQRSGVSGSRLHAVSAANPFVEFGWTRHRLYFSDRPLGEIADELRRYHRGWIFIVNDRIAQTRISGGLDLDNPAAAVQELARLGGASLSRVSDRLLILR